MMIAIVDARGDVRDGVDAGGSIGVGGVVITSALDIELITNPPARASEKVVALYEFSCIASSCPVCSLETVMVARTRTEAGETVSVMSDASEPSSSIAKALMYRA